MLMNIAGLYIFIGVATAYVVIKNIRDNSSAAINAEMDNLGGVIPNALVIIFFWPVILLVRIARGVSN